MSRTAGGATLAVAGLLLFVPLTGQPMPDDVVFTLESPTSRATTTCQVRPVEFPADLRAVGIQGTVRVVLELTDTGSVNDAAIVKSSGSEVLDKSALVQMRKAKCEPLVDPVTMRAVAGAVYPRIRFTLPEPSQ